ncbi:MAG: SprT family zinc-dependent metalloprotease [Pseudomonadota bacterium]
MFRRGTRRVIKESCLRLEREGEALECTLRRSNRRRSLALRVDAQGGVVVNAPMTMPEAQIQGFVGRHWHWIRDKRQQSLVHAMAWREGARLPYLGGELRLALHPPAGRPRVWLEGDSLCCAAQPAQVEAAVLAWYQGQARTLLAERLESHASRIGRAGVPLRLSGARTRWGSLSPKGVVSLNWRLLKASQAEIDYVVCHELAHFRQRNHSPAFWREVETLFPQWATVRRSLRENGRRYFEF